MMQKCDTLFMIGTTYPYAQFLAQGRSSARRADRHRRARICRCVFRTRSTSSATAPPRCAALLPLLDAKDGPGVARAHRRKARALGDGHRRRGPRTRREPLNPQKVFAELSPRLPDNCILSGDAGTSTNWSARDLQMRRGMKFSLSGQSGDDGTGGPVRDRGEVLLSRIASRSA